MSHEHLNLRVMLIGDEPVRMSAAERELGAAGHRVIARTGLREDWAARAAGCQPQLVFVTVERPLGDTFAGLSQLGRECPCPLILGTAQGDADTIRQAVQAGVGACVLDGVQSDIRTAVEIAFAHFETHRGLRRDLDQARARLADQRDIQRAKGLIMKRRQLDENEAFILLRSMAMDRKQRLGDFARAVLGAADGTPQE